MSDKCRNGQRRKLGPLLAALFFSCVAQTAASAPPKSPDDGARALVVPKALSVPAIKCSNIKVSKPLKAGNPFISLNVLIAKAGALQVLFFVADFPLEMPGGYQIRSGALYYRFDDDAPTYIESGSPESQKRYGVYFQRLVFGNLTAGPHRLAYGLTSPNRGFVSFGQICFTVRDVNWQYFIGGFANEREILIAPPLR